MSTLSIQPPLPIFTDIDGQPLEEGYVWLGVVNLDPITNPVSAYWDAGLTQPVTQPVRTRGGYPMNGAAPARLYVNSDYSIRVMNKNGSMVYSAPSATERYNDVVVNVSATAVSFQQQGSSLVRTIADKGYEQVTVNDFPGADPTGSTSSSAAIAAAMAAADVVVFEGGTWLIDQNLSLASGKRLIGKSGAVIYRNTDVRIVGPTPTLTEITATADFLYGSTLVTLDSASYAAVSVGQYLWFKDKTSANVNYILDFVAATSDQLNDPSDWIYQVQAAKIVEKLAGNAVRINAAAHVDFPFTGAGKIYSVSNVVVEDVVIDGLTFRNGTGLSGASAEAAFINFQYVYNITIQNCKFDLKGYTGGIYAQFGQTNISNNEFDAPAQLGVFLRQAMPDSVVSGNVFRNQTTGDASIFVEAHNYNIAISDNTFDGARAYELADAAQLICAVQMDAKVNNVTIVGNSMNGYGVGIRMELGCMFNTITGNTIANCNISGLRIVQSSQNVFTGNTFYNCGLAPSPGILANAQGTIFTSSTTRNIFSGNQIAYDAGNGRTAFYLNGNDDLFTDNIIINATDSVVSGSSNRIANNVFKSSLATSQIINITGTSAHYNVLENNQLISDVSCVYGIRFDSGSECNTARNNVSKGCDFTIGVTSTTNAQSLYENTRYSDSNTATVNVYNIEISAPVMPVNATMPRRFRIYSTTTAAGSGALAPQGASWWEFTQEVAGTKYFQRFDISTTQVGI